MPKTIQKKINPKVKQARAILAQAGNTIFTATFVKKDGSIRKMNCRLHVKKGVTGVGLPYDPAKYNLQPVWEMFNAQEKNGTRRMINLETLKYLTVAGKIVKL